MPAELKLESSMPHLSMRRSISSDGAVGTDRLRHLEQAALRHGVPVEDVLLIAVNLYGITSDQDRHRARVNLRLVRRPDAPWQIIVPLNQPASPFRLRSDELSLNGEVVAHVGRIDADEAVGGYFRNDGRAATLNPNARSRCVGCGWCPNTLEAAADPRMQEDQGLDALLHALGEQHPRRSLAELTEVTVSTGCFEREEAAVAHLTALRPALERAGVKARIGFLTSVLRSDEAFETIASKVSPFVLRLTAEHFTRREALMKATKADLRPEQMPDLLMRARAAGLDTSYTYIVGLDPMEDLVRGVNALAGEVTAFPNFQVFQAHTVMMQGMRTPGAESLEYYLQARTAIERAMAPTGLRPVGWECYRPLWYFTYAGEEEGHPVEQIDGALEVDGSAYLVEIKWWGEPVEINAMSRHLVRVYGRSEVRALFISASGFTGPAIEESERALNQRVIVLGELRELVLLLERQGDVAAWLREKVRFAQLERRPLALLGSDF